MSNYLFALIDGGGAVPPALSVAGALVRNGHDVRVLGDPVLRAEVEAVGARHIDWTTAPVRHERSKDADIVADWQARTPLGAMARTRDGFMVGPAAEYAQDTLDELARCPADAVVSEMLCMGAMLGGQAAGVPVAALITTVLPLPVPGRPPFGPGFMPARGPLGRARDAAVARLSSAMWNKALPKLNATRAQHGLPAFQHVFEQLAEVDRVVVLTSEAFEFPGGPVPPNVRYVGPRLDDPEWVEEWTPPTGDQPLVLVGMSSTYQDHVSMLRRVAAGLGRLPVRGLITTGPTVTPDDIDAPPNVTVVRSAPHAEVLEHAGAVVTHAGHGTVSSRSPMGSRWWQCRSAATSRMSPPASWHRGPACDCGRDRLRGRSLWRWDVCVDEPAFSAASSRMADEIRRDVEEDRAVAELETLVGDRRKGGSKLPLGV